MVRLLLQLCCWNLSLGTVLLGAESRDSESTTTAPTQLSCELLTNPEATTIHDPQPELAWICGMGESAFQQSAYQIEVCKAAARDRINEQTVWDTGRVDSDQSIDVEYAGAVLQPGGRYVWRVRTWDNEGRQSPWSDWQSFRMAIDLNSSTSLYAVETVPRAAQKLTKLRPSKYLVDFGKDAFGYLDLKVPPIGRPRTLEVHFGEKLRRGRIDRRPGGSIRHFRVRVEIPARVSTVSVRPPRDERNTSGNAILLPERIGVIAPFRYVELIGELKDLNVANVSRVQVQYPFDDGASDFQSSDATLNTIWQLCKYSIQATTYCGIYVDGDRERIPYEADAYINQLAHYGVDREYALARHSHEYLLIHSTWPTEWKQHSILMAWADYCYTGNKESLKRHYELLKRKKLLTPAERSDCLMDTSGPRFRDIVDWPEVERDGFEMRPINTVVNAFHYATLTRMARIASVLGHGEDESLFKDKARTLRKEFNRVLWNTARECYVDGVGSEHSSIHANLFPLAFGLVPAEREHSVVQFLKSRGMQCSVYAAQYLLEGLYCVDEDQYALELLRSRDQRSWYNMIRCGSTITMEAWDQEFKPNLDWNHAWGAAPADLIPRYLVGVRPLEPGFKQVLIQPRPGDLENFSARVPSLRGPIGVQYDHEDGMTKLIVDVPGNCSANVGVPIADENIPTDLRWNDSQVAVNVRGKHAWIDGVPPGRHAFIARFLATANVDVPVSEASAR